MDQLCPDGCGACLPGAGAGRLRRAARGDAAVPDKPEVSVVTIKSQPRSIVRELPGRIAPIRVADVRPRVSGIILQRLFQQGSEVKAGDPLYQIDPRPFDVELQAAEAALAKAKAAREQAELQAKRVSTLASEQAASRAAERSRGQRLASGRGRGRGARGRGRPRQAQSGIRHHPRADQRPDRRRAGQRGRAGGAERRRQPRHHPAARPRLCRLHPAGRPK